MTTDRYYVLDRVDEDRFMEAKTFQNIVLIRVAEKNLVRGLILFISK